METITTICSGCRSCEQICPKNAISMVYDQEGFLQFKINKNLCINCGLCQKRCPQENYNRLKQNPNKVYAAQVVDASVLLNSTSGGIFWCLAENIISKGGVVYGCAFEKDFSVSQIRITNMHELSRLQGSKYVQSDTGDSFTMVKNDLADGKYVLYSGTPCQIAGLKLFLGNMNEKLLLMDILCHGVPSPLLFKKYIEWIQLRYNRKLKTYQFRFKKNGYGGRYLLRLDFGEKVKCLPIMLDPYGDAFLKGRTLREACYSCKFATIERVGDISLGDYWKPEVLNCDFDVSKGVSMVLINSDKAVEIWNQIARKIVYKETTIEQAVSVNDGLKKAVQRPSDRGSLLKEYNSLDYFNKQLAVGIKLKLRISNMLPIALKEKIKRCIKRGNR